MTKYTWKDVFKNSKRHPLGEGSRCSNFNFGDFRVSIVGGKSGLYGNFFDTFELAIIDAKTNDFVTSELLSELKYRSDDDVYGYLDLDQVVNILNFLNEKYNEK